MKLSEINVLTRTINGAAIEVHRTLGPGLLESIYEECLCAELKLRGVEFQRQVPIPLTYKGLKLASEFRIDILVARSVVVEIKAVAAVLSVYEQQVLTYCRLGGWPIGLLLNFNVPMMKLGINRIINGHPEPEQTHSA